MINWLKNKLRKFLDIPTPEQYAKEVVDISLVLVQNMEAHRQLEGAKKEFLETCQKLNDEKIRLEEIKNDLEKKEVEKYTFLQEQKKYIQEQAISQMESAIETSKAREKAKRKLPPFVH